MDFLRLLVSDRLFNESEPDYRWASLTATLSVLVVIGYVVMAFKWYFQSRFARNDDSKRTFAVLQSIAGCCAAGFALVLWHGEWWVWRAYDMTLGILAAYIWWRLWRMRGMSLVNERLSEVAELEESARRYRDIAELLPQIVWTATSEGGIDYMNHRWREYAGSAPTWLDAIHPDDRRAAWDWWSATVADQASVSRELRLGGTQGYRAFVVKATRISRGGSVMWLGACSDIEDQKLLLREKESQAAQKAFFLNALSHDLRAPLNNVVLNAQLLKMSITDPDACESADMIVENAIAGAELVSQLLEYAKAGAEDYVQAASVSVSELLHHVERRFMSLVAKKGLYFEITGMSHLVAVTDRMKLERVLTNLVDNAIKFTTRGGITIELTAQESKALVRVIDTGPGVADEHVARLFDEFYQVDNHERNRRKGFGMGLAICRRLARQLGGDVRLASTAPSGSCFEVTFDVTDHGSGGRRDGAPSDVGDPEAARLCAV